MTVDELKDRLSRFQDWLLNRPDAQESRVLGFFHRQLRVAYAVGRDVAGGNLTLHAMSLVYTTLLSIVPLLA
ncbi:MAG: ribonuclease BN, partial [Halomonadaceae bacterium]